MTLLERVIAAAEGDGSVPSLLRMMKTLAFRTGAHDLGTWVGYELGGYPVGRKVPDYRGPFELQILADFMDGSGHRYRNVPIDKIRFPPEAQDGALFSAIFREPVSEIEIYAAQEYTRWGWTADFVLGYNLCVQRGMFPRVLESPWEMTHAEAKIVRSRFVGILDQIRNQAHALALELEQSVPMAGEPDADPEAKAKAVIIINQSQSFNFSNSTFSNSNNAFGSSDFEQSIALPSQGNSNALEASLASAGVSADDIAVLRDALEGDDRPSDELGPGVMRWLKELSGKVAPAVLTVITQAICAYYGLPIGGESSPS